MHSEEGCHLLAVTGLATGQQVEHLETGFLLPVTFSLEPLFKIVGMFLKGWNRDTHKLPSRLGSSQR
jgi:hypothetical protein